MNLEEYIASIPGFPKEGILFRDVTPILANPKAYQEAVHLISEYASKVGATVIAAPEARGFWFGCPVATNLSLGLVPVRKPGKLPREVIKESYDLEYGSNEVSMHADAIKPGDKVLIVDDLLATGGTAKATAKMVERLGGEVVGCAFIIELYGNGMDGRGALKDYDVYSILHMSDN